MLLISRTDFKTYNRQISNNIHVDVLNMHISDAQLQDVKPLLGEEFYNKIIQDSASYDELLNGGQYDYNGITYTNVGLKAVLVYFAHARFIYYGSEINTAFGTVAKNEFNSTPTSIAIKKQFYNSNRQSASYMWDNVRDYLQRMDIEDFHCGNNRKVNNIKIFKIGR